MNFVKLSRHTRARTWSEDHTTEKGLPQASLRTLPAVVKQWLRPLQELYTTQGGADLVVLL